jgi:hypothetical protein
VCCQIPEIEGIVLLGKTVLQVSARDNSAVFFSGL